MPISPLDFVLLQFGSPGYYQVFLGFLLCCFQLPIIFTDYLFKYYTYEPPHRCQLPLRKPRFLDTNIDLNMHKNEWFPVNKKPNSMLISNKPNIDQLLQLNMNSSSHVFDQCNIYLDPVHHWKGTQPCPNGWEFWLPDNEQNLITEFNLVCDQKYYVTILFYSTCVAAFGGSILFGLLADKWSRRKTLNFTLYLFVASSLSAYFSADIIQFSVFYILEIFFINGLQVSAFVLLVELFPTPFHLQASIMWVVFGILTSLVVPLLVYAINSWRYLQLSIAVPSFAFFTYIFVIPPSPLWLTVVKQNLTLAVKTLNQFGRFNGKSLITSQLNLHVQNQYSSTLSVICQVNDNSDNVQQTHHHQQVFVRPKLSKPGPVLRWFLLSHFYLFFVVTLINSDLLAPHSLILHKNQHVNEIYHSFLDLGVVILAYHLAMWLGGKAVQALFFFTSGFLIVVSVVLKEYFKSRTNTEFEDTTFDYRFFLLPPTLVVVSSSLGHAAWAFVWYFAVKTIPTNVRATGLSLCIFWSQIAKLSTPHLILLSTYLPNNILLGSLGVMAIIAGALTLLFPQVDQKPLPNTIDDLDDGKYCKNTSSTLSSKQYPSYQDIKVYRVSQPLSTGSNVYTINRTENGTNGVMTDAQLLKSNFEYQPNQTFTKNTLENVNIKDMMNFIQHNSFSQSSTRNETDKSSLSSTSRNNSLSRNITDHSLIQMSPSTSFIAMNPNNKQTYVAYNNEMNSDINDLFTVELDNEFTVENFNASLGSQQLNRIEEQTRVDGTEAFNYKPIQV